jgi:hypothetical protein
VRCPFDEIAIRDTCRHDLAIIKCPCSLRGRLIHAAGPKQPGSPPRAGSCINDADEDQLLSDEGPLLNPLRSCSEVLAQERLRYEVDGPKFARLGDGLGC